MTLRLIKCALAAFLGLLGFIYGLENIANLDAAYNVISTVLSMAGHEYYPNSIGPAISSPILVWITVALIITGEISGGAIALKGAYDLFMSRHKDTFNEAKKTLYIGAGVLLIVWFGFFTVIGGAFFQMWQTELGSMSLEGAFQFVGSVTLVTLFIALPD
ncbi:MAG: DUF2165 family protein [Sphingomonadales bacterium]|jgi:predicted small integral membrane protein